MVMMVQMIMPEYEDQYVFQSGEKKCCIDACFVFIITFKCPGGVVMNEMS